MIRFNSDYIEGAVPDVLDALIRTNEAQTNGYGEDEYCDAAREAFKREVGDPNAAVHFLVGGTQTNFTVISAALRPHQSVLTADSGHVFVHESGAIEATGHKCETLPTEFGKISAAAIAEKCEAHLHDPNFEHTVQPKLVYLSQPTELGTIYSADELQAIRDVCDRYGLLLYVDGARLIYALTCPENDLDLKTLHRLADVFYFGGTKAGLLFGEALIIRNETLKQDFRYIQKQRGGMLAKGRLLGVQFGALLDNGLYLQLGAHANQQAERIRAKLRSSGVRFLVESPTNQLFPIFSNRLIAALQQKFAVSFIERVSEDKSCIRICTHGGTKGADVEALLCEIESLLKLEQANSKPA